MKTSIYIFITFFILLGCKQSENKDNKTFVISRGCIWAQVEFNRDKFEQLMLIRYGEPPDDKEEYFWSILENDYNIIRKFSTGCIIDKGIERYNKLMEEEIKKRFGNDFFQKIDAKVDSIYEINKPLIEIVKKQSFVDTTKSLYRFSVLNTGDNNIKVVSGYGWCMINKKPRVTSLFRVTINRYSKEMIKIDTTRIEVSPLGYR